MEVTTVSFFDDNRMADPFLLLKAAIMARANTLEGPKRQKYITSNHRLIELIDQRDGKRIQSLLRVSIEAEQRRVGELSDPPTYQEVQQHAHLDFLQLLNRLLDVQSS